MSFKAFNVTPSLFTPVGDRAATTGDGRARRMCGLAHRHPTICMYAVSIGNFRPLENVGFFTIHTTWSKGFLLWTSGQWSKMLSIRLQTAVSTYPWYSDAHVALFCTLAATGYSGL